MTLRKHVTKYKIMRKFMVEFLRKFLSPNPSIYFNFFTMLGSVVMGSLLSHQSEGGWSERSQELSKNGRVKLDHQHMHHGSQLLVIFLAFSIQPNLGLLRTRTPRTLSVNTLLAIWYSSILSTCLTCPN